MRLRIARAILVLLLIAVVMGLASGNWPVRPGYADPSRVKEYDWARRIGKRLPCATWENGGLEWAVNMSGEWEIVITQPSYRRCWVFPPFPAKPRKAHLVRRLQPRP
ncbi:MAG: hypothetical protein OXF83_06870 [Anaerolineaceae bacterium]|nr:hypothetical protein [Anaerolineaceae bacterium]